MVYSRTGWKSGRTAKWKIRLCRKQALPPNVASPSQQILRRTLAAWDFPSCSKLVTIQVPLFRKERWWQVPKYLIWWSMKGERRELMKLKSRLKDSFCLAMRWTCLKYSGSPTVSYLLMPIHNPIYQPATLTCQDSTESVLSVCHNAEILSSCLADICAYVYHALNLSAIKAINAQFADKVHIPLFCSFLISFRVPINA